MWQFVIVIFLDWWEIQFDQIWSILNRSDPKKIKNITGIFILSVNVTTFYSNIFRLVRNPIWSSLIKFDQVWSSLIHFGQIWSKKIKKTKNILMWQLFIVTFLDWWEIHFDQVWSILDRSDPKKIKNRTAIFIHFVNVATFYSNIFWLARNPIWSSLIHFGQIWSKKIKNITAMFILSVNVATFYCNMFSLVRNSIWSSLITFDPFLTDLILKKSK